MARTFGIAAALICLIEAQTAFAFSWQPCGEGKADISTVSLTPESPEPGVTVQFAIKGTASALPVALRIPGHARHLLWLGLAVGDHSPLAEAAV